MRRHRVLRGVRPLNRTLHLVALPHTQTTSDYPSCAYTQKVVKFCRMMQPLGWDVVLYAGEHNDAPVAEHVQLISEAERSAWFGEGFDTVLTPLRWDAEMPYWRTQAARARAAIKQRASERDLILISTGTQWPIRDAFPFPSRIVCEPFVGYEGVATEFRAFESATFMHTVYAKRGIVDGRDPDAVIPNYFDMDEFPHVSSGGDYLLYVGRLVRRKGVLVAAEVAKAAGLPLKIAGPGALEYKPGEVLVAPEFRLEGDHFEYVGEVGVHDRAELMAGAHALLAPTSFLEPFGGVAVEAQLCGTPAITTDHGAFMETVDSAFRFRNMQGALDAVQLAGEIDRPTLRELTISRYSLEAVAPLYDAWFGRLLDLWNAGWYELRGSHTSALAERIRA